MTKPRKGDLFYLIDVDENGDDKRRKYKIYDICAGWVFFKAGFWSGLIHGVTYENECDLQPNPDKSSKVRWILYK